MSEEKLRSAKASLKEALAETDDEEAVFYLREALHLLSAAEWELAGPDAEPSGGEDWTSYFEN